MRCNASIQAIGCADAIAWSNAPIVLSNTPIFLCAIALSNRRIVFCEVAIVLQGCDCFGEGAIVLVKVRSGFGRMRSRFVKVRSQVLQRYYDANQLLIDCLNSHCEVTTPIRQEIEATLLLPQKELEDREWQGD